MADRILSFGRAAPADVVVHGDSAAVAAGAAPGSVDLVYVDPPFATGKVQRGRGGAYQDAPDDPEAHVAWLTPWLEASRAALTPTGSLFVHLDWRTVHYVKVALDRLFGRACFAGELIWCYAVGGKSRRGFGRKHDTILWYGRGKDWAFYPDQVRIARRGGSHMRVVLDEHGQRVQEKTDRRTGKVYRYPVADGKVPEDWWTDIETLNHSDGERTGWPSQKPERLLARVIDAVTRPGDLVADWFAGSGTTAVVAQRGARRFVVADAADDAIAITTARLERQGQALAAAGTPPPPVVISSAAAAAPRRTRTA